MAAIGAGVCVLGAWIVAPGTSVTAWLAAGAALLQSFRLSRWAGDRTTSEPLVAICTLLTRSYRWGSRFSRSASCGLT